MRPFNIEFVSVHGQGQLVISAFDFDGSPRFTVELNETFTSSESASCFLAQSGNDILLFRNGEPRVSLITADGHISWTRTVSKAGFHFYRIDGNQKSGNVMVSGKGHGQIRLVFLSLSDGMVTNEVSLTTSSTELPAVLETEDKLVLVYTEGDQLYGYDLTAQMKYLLDTGAVGQDANGRGAASLEAWPYANSLSDSFFLRYSDGISFLILMKSVVDIEIHEIEPIGDSLQIPSRDNEPYAAIFTHLEEDKRYVLEIMELSTGQVIERHLLEDLFPNEIIAGHFQSLIDNDGYFAWKFYTMDASGGFASYHSDEISKAPMTRTDDDSTPLIDEISHDEL